MIWGIGVNMAFETLSFSSAGGEEGGYEKAALCASAAMIPDFATGSILILSSSSYSLLSLSLPSDAATDDSIFRASWRSLELEEVRRVAPATRESGSERSVVSNLWFKRRPVFIKAPFLLSVQPLGPPVLRFCDWGEIRTSQILIRPGK